MMPLIGESLDFRFYFSKQQVQGLTRNVIFIIVGFTANVDFSSLF